MENSKNSYLNVPSVSEVCYRIKNLLNSEFDWVVFKGEVSSFNCHRASGHWYFTLKDARAQLECAMFRGNNMYVNFSPKVGDLVEVGGKIDVYEKNGRMQCYVREMRKSGAGALYEEFLRLRTRLEKEGLFRPEIKKPVPRVPMRIGIITGLQTAALRDVLNRLEERAPFADIVIYPTPVQGLDAAKKIASAISAASRRKETDVLLLVRGGGSIEELWCFNEEIVARAIRASEIPVISGIGHESDFTIADLAADLRAPTPTAAAEHASEHVNVLEHRLETCQNALTSRMRQLAETLNLSLDIASREVSSPQKLFQSFVQKLDNAVASMRLSRTKISDTEFVLASQKIRDAAHGRIREYEKRLFNASLDYSDTKLLTAKYRERIVKNVTAMELMKMGSLRGNRERLAEAANRLRLVRPSFSSEAAASMQAENSRFIRNALAEKRDLLKNAEMRLRESKPSIDLSKVNHLSENLCQNMSNRLKSLSSRLKISEASLEALDPENVLKRGYAWVERNGEIVPFAADLTAEEQVNICFSDGKANARIVAVNLKHSAGGADN